MPLAPPRGPYPVSTLTLELPVCQPRSFGAGRFKLRGAGSGSSCRDAFRLDTVLVTLFYPTQAPAEGKSAQAGRYWLGEPRLKAVEGLLKYAGVSRYLAYPASFLLPYKARLPYRANGPLAAAAAAVAPAMAPAGPAHGASQEASSAPQHSESHAASGDSSTAFPVGVFSHGLAGTQMTYSAYLADLASEGMVIASVEHRDLSCPLTTVRRPDSGETQSPQVEQLLYTKFDELDTTADADADAGEGNSAPDVWAMRRAQLDLRQAEMLEAVHILERLNNGEGSQLLHSSTRPLSAAEASCARIDDWRGRLNLSSGLWALGHSFGGATSIELLRRTDSPFSHAVVLDPWLEPINKSGEGVLLKRPLYTINSEAFTIWRSHFAQLRSLAAESRRHTGSGWLLSIAKTKHTDFSDFPFVMPRFFKPSDGGRPPLDVLTVFSRASRMAFLQTFDRDRLGLPMRDERPGEVEARDLGAGGEVIWHALDGPIGPAADGEGAKL